MLVYFLSITCGQRSRQSFLAPRIFGCGLLLVCKRYDGNHTFRRIQFRTSDVYLPFLVLGYVGPWYWVRKHSSWHVPVNSSDIFIRSNTWMWYNKLHGSILMIQTQIHENYLSWRSAFQKSNWIVRCCNIIHWSMSWGASWNCGFDHIYSSHCCIFNANGEQWNWFMLWPMRGWKDELPWNGENMS